MNDSSASNGRFHWKEPIFRDEPFDQSQWYGLYELLKRTNAAKAELLPSAYESARIAYQNYQQAQREELDRYAHQRPQDEAHNQALREEQARLMGAIREIYDKWQPQIEQKLQDYLQALEEAKIAGARVGVNLRGEPLFGGREAEDADSNPQTNGQADPNLPNANETPVRNADRLPMPASSEWRDTFAPEVSRPRYEEPPPRTESEVAHERNLPTVKTYLLNRPLWWTLVVVGGAFTGLMLLIALGGDLEAWDRPLFWLALLGGVMLHLLWVPALWGASAVVGELYHLFRWDANKSQREAWVVGVGLMGLPILLFSLLAILMTTLGQLRPAEPLHALVLAISALLIVPTVAIALLEGFLYGRSVPVRHHHDTEVTQAVRHYLQQQRAQEQAPADPPEDSSPQGFRSPLQTDSNPTANPSMNATTNNRAQSEREQSWRDFQEAHAGYTARWSIYRYTLEQRDLELQPYYEALARLDWRPIYEYLPPYAEARLETLYNQWREAFLHFLKLLREAVRELRDGEELARALQEYTLLIGSARTQTEQ